jgi:hypothetical protein
VHGEFELALPERAIDGDEGGDGEARDVDGEKE